MKRSYVAVGLTLLLLTVTGNYFLYQSQKYERPQPSPPSSVQGVSTEVKRPELPAYSIKNSELLKLTNETRTQNGIPPLREEPLLDKSATDKCKDMATKQYWAHNTPEGSRPWVFITPYITEYRKLGENLSLDNYTSEKVVQEWRNSPTHNANLLEAKFDRVGFAICDYTPKHPLVVQHFAG